jgi:hypothetical protein
MLQALRICAVQAAKYARQLLVGDQTGFAILRVFGDVTARIRVIATVSPDFGHIEHLPQARQHAICRDRRLFHALDQRRNIRASEVRNLNFP